jgi:hypothetical protein
MFLKDKEIESVLDESISFKDGTQTVISKEKQFYLITEKSTSDSEYEVLEGKFMLKEIFNAIAARNILLSFDDQEEVKDQANVDTTAEVIKIMQKHDYPLYKLDAIFHGINSYLTSINNLTQNNITAIQNEVVVKHL